MNNLILQIQSRISLLKKALAQAEKEEGSFPEGHLRVSTSRCRNRYYHISMPGDHVGEYLTKDKITLARILAQKDYNHLFVKRAQEELKLLEQTLFKLSAKNADLAYQNLSPSRQTLIKPYITPDEIYAREWQAKPFKGNPYMPENKIYDTRRGEKVRSKSEAILADMFYRLGIPYLYEKPVNLKNGSTRYPDFTLLKISSREEIYLEHFGLLDDDEYRNSFFHKLYEYRQSGIYPGKNLLFTYETAEYPLDIKGIEKTMKELLL